MSRIEFTVNGKKCSADTNLYRETTLYAYLRYTLSLPGTKAMCKQGVCGACIVTVRGRRQTFGDIEIFSVNSCLVLIFSCHGWEITTIEGLGNRHIGYSEIQKRLACLNATQCGFCTPGWGMQINTFLHKNLTMEQLEKLSASNTCRCTGYRPILDTMKSFAVDASPELCQQVKDIEDISRCKTNCQRKLSVTSISSDWTIVDQYEENEIITLNFGNSVFVKVFTEDQIFVTINNYIDPYILIDGDTSKGVLKDFEYPPVIIDISDVSTLKKYSFDQNLVLGANITIEDCITIFRDVSKKMDEFKYLEQFAEHLELVAHYSVRIIGSLAGNFMIKHKLHSYPSDLFLLFESVGAIITIRSKGGSQSLMPLTTFLDYDMREQLIVSFMLPPQAPNHIFRSYKIMQRSLNALAIVNAAFNFKINESTNVIESAIIVYGNISGSFNHASRTETYLKGKNVFNNNMLQEAISLLDKEIVPENKPPEPAPRYRKKLAIGLFYKFILNISPSKIILSKYKSGGTLINRPISRGTQTFQTDPTLYPLNQPVQKYEALIQSSGEAQYVNDIPPMPHEVFAAFVLSDVYSGKVDNINIEEILQIDGVLAIYTAKDIPGDNSFTYPGYPLQTDVEQILAEEVQFHGQPVAIVAAVNEILAVNVAKKVKVTYKNVSNAPPVLTISDAMKDSKRYVAGDSIEPKRRGNDVKKIVKGVYETGAQYHYYLEPLTCIVIPIDRGLEVYDATQWLDLTQTAIAKSLNMKESDVFVKVRRLGGGFGGKISRNVQVATACALVAKKLDRPCRFILPFQTNLTIAGRRLPCRCEYEVGVDDNGKIQYLNANIIEDDGCSHNEGILSFTSGGFPNCYDKDVINLKTGSVTTNLPSNTFARAPGTMEGIASIEHIMEHISYAVQKDPTDVRLINMRKEDNALPGMIEELKKEADYENRLEGIKNFNRENRWMKKAIKISVMSFPVVYFGNYSVMVSIFRGDGSVDVSTAGVEMGQGINTKIAQVVAYELGISLDLVSIVPNFSIIAANCVFTGSSITSESCSYAAIKACEGLNKRLQPLKDKMGNPTWLDLVQKAGEEQINLTETFMMTDKEPDLEGYPAYTVVILEVQLDVLVGRFQIIRVDIVEDVGVSTNQTIDIGQVEGAYIQGLSCFTVEKFIYDRKTGKLLNNSALNYEVFLAKDIPIDFRVKLRYNSKNPKGVLGSKAVGEMGVCTSYGITHALRQCIMESRKDSGYDPTQWIDIDIPYTTDSILKALNVNIKEFTLTT